MVIRIQPDEGVDVRFEVKCPGQIAISSRTLEFRYAEAFGPLPDAYETLLLDVMLGDATLFVRDDWAEASSGTYAPLLENPPATCFYPAGRWGPKQAGELFQESPCP